MRTSRILAALALTTLLSVTAACGSDHGSGASLPRAETGKATDSKAGGGKKLDPDDAMLQWSKCMREHGVDLPDPVDGMVQMPVGDKATMDAANKACAPIMKDVTQNAPKDSIDSGKFEEMLLAQAKCLRKKGYDVPDPVSTAAGSFDGGQYPANAHGPVFDKAMAECNKQVGLGNLQSFSNQAQGEQTK